MHFLRRFGKDRNQEHPDQTSCFLLTLPNELLLHICSYLDQTADLRNAHLTCKALRESALWHLYRTVFVLSYKRLKRGRSLFRALCEPHISAIVTSLTITLSQYMDDGRSSALAFWTSKEDSYKKEQQQVDEALQVLYNLKELTVVCTRCSFNRGGKASSVRHGYLARLGTQNLRSLSMRCSIGDDGLTETHTILRAACLQRLTSLCWEMSFYGLPIDHEDSISEAADCLPLLEALEYRHTINPFLDRLLAVRNIRSLTCRRWDLELHNIIQVYPAQRNLRSIDMGKSRADLQLVNDVSQSTLWCFLDLIHLSPNPYQNLSHVGTFDLGFVDGVNILEAMRRLTLLPNLWSFAAFNIQHQFGVGISSSVLPDPSSLRDPWNEELLTSISSSLPNIIRICLKVPYRRQPGVSAILWSKRNNSWHKNELGEEDTALPNASVYAQAR